MSEMSSTVENDPPAAPVITTRAKVVRESFTVLRSDFEASPPPQVSRPQAQVAAPIASGGQNNLGLSIGGGIVLVGGIFAFLFFGYGSNKSAATATKPAKAAGAANGAVAVTTDTAKHIEKTRPHEAHPEVQAAPHKTAPNPIAEHHPVPAPPVRKEPVESAAKRVEIPRPRELSAVPHESRLIARVKAATPVAALPKPVPHVEAPPPVHHVEHTSHAPAQSSGHSDNSPELDPLHSLGNN